jgi:ATP-dependent Lhr-like helicase
VPVAKIDDERPLALAEGAFGFQPLVSTWFERRFRAPSPIQALAWPLIASGRDTLLTAPTGSGKTLAAFLHCLDALIRRASEGEALGTSVVYVSPLKALSNDVHQNLVVPIAELRELAPELGVEAPELRVMVRTGDTPAHERRRAIREPPHVLVTTPESLFILLTSGSGRQMLRGARTLIVDEIHAMLADKRGAHLALSIERLDELVRQGGGQLQRIGLSATVKPMEAAARLLTGAARPLPAIADAGSGRALDLAIEPGKDELAAVCTNEQWADLYDRLAELIGEHRSTIVFVNTRRLVERVAHNLGERLGPERVAAHHGSLSRARRHEAERRLKAGELRAIVATASLELGIDVGSVDLACLIGSPRSIATAVQRVGRSGHALGAVPKGRFFPLTRDQLVETAAIVRAARRGALDGVLMRAAPLDVLAQQLVAICASEEQSEDALFDLVRRAAPYERLPREEYEAVVAMLSEGIATRRGRAGALLHRDEVRRKLRGRRAARLTAITSGGAIADNANFDVVLEPEGVKIGTVDEDFAVESMAGDFFLLGNDTWRIRRIESGKVRVEAAPGASPGVPFWLGEAPSRTAELSAEVARLRDEVSRQLDRSREAAVAFLQRECGLDRPGAQLLCDYVAAGKAALGEVPTQTTLIAERFFDEAGGMQLVLHAPFGGRINRAFGLALRKRFCRSFDFELQAAATDDGVLLSLGPQHSLPLAAIFDMLRPETLAEVLEQAVLQAPMFGTRFRWNASRALALPRYQGGRRMPPPLQRMRSDDLLASIFPAQQGCQDNRGAGEPVEVPDHPLITETMRDCLSEALDADGLRRVLEDIQAGKIRTLARETPEPSVFSHEILNANPYAFLDDAPLEERRARAVGLRRGLPVELVDRLGGLDPQAIEAVREEAAPVVRGEDELHDLLLELVLLPAAHAMAQGLEPLFAELVSAKRAARLEGPRGAAWVAAERKSLAERAWPSAVFRPELVAPPSSRGARPVDREAALAELVRGWLAVLGPVTSEALAELLALPAGEVTIALHRLEGDGVVLRGRFSPGLPMHVTEWCDRRLLARIHRRTVSRLRAEIEPVTAAELLRFLFVHHGVEPAHRLHGPEGLARVIAQLQGFELAAAAWERDVLPLRIKDYDPSLLDALCLSGEVVWGRLSARKAAKIFQRQAPITLAPRRELGLWLTPRDPEDEALLSHPARDALHHLRRAGASFTADLVRGTGRLACEIEDGLAELVGSGWVTGDGFGGLRALLTPASKRSRGPRQRANRLRRQAAPLALQGRWSLLQPPSFEPAEARADDEARVEGLARQYLRRYGVVFRELLARESDPPPFRELLRVYRRLELSGELRGGRMVQGVVGEQFATPEALDALRAVRREGPKGALVRVSACDPLNLVGILTPGLRVPAELGSYVAYRDGVPIAESEDSRLCQTGKRSSRAGQRR